MIPANRSYAYHKSSESYCVFQCAQFVVLLQLTSVTSPATNVGILKALLVVISDGGVLILNCVLSIAYLYLNTPR